MPHRILLLIVAIGVGIACFLAGLQLSSRRPLWNDELYTHTNSITAVSYKTIAQGKTVEGNNAPLFYLAQKFVVDISQAKLRQEWKGEWFVHDRSAQVRLRLLSNICMSLAIALVIYFLGMWFSFGFAFLCVGLFLSAPSIWTYWIEARPYALWILLTVVQSLFFIKAVMKEASSKEKFESGLLIANLLLSLTIAFGAVQSLVVYAALWVKNKMQWLVYGLCSVVSVGIAGFYFQQSPKFKYWFSSSPWQLILENVPVEFWLLGLICVAGMIYAKNSSSEKNGIFAGGYLPFAGLTVCSALAVLMMLKIKATLGPEGFAISSRYFLFLTPVVSLALGFWVRQTWHSLKSDPWMRMNLILAVGGLLMLRGFKTYVYLLGSGVFMHAIQ